MSQINSNSQATRGEDEIDLLDLFKTVWKQRGKVLLILLTFMFIGLFVAIFSGKEFTASSTFVPQISEPNRAGGSLGGLASLAGINMGGVGQGTEIPPQLYPKITSSVTYKKALLAAKLNVDGVAGQVSYGQYYDSIHSPGVLGYVKKYTLGLPGVIIKSIKGESEETIVETDNGLIKISAEEHEHFQRMESQMSVTPNDKEGFVSLTFVMPEPVMAAQMAIFAQELLQKEVIAYKISNAKEQLKFTEERFEEKKTEFNQIQSRLANFRDRNQNINSATAMNQLQRLEAEYNFAFNIYTELAKQLEQAKLQVSKDTPVFSVIQPVSVPIEKSAPKRPLILVIFTILGIIVALAYVFGSEFLRGVKEQWGEEEE
ncbi:Wzz/FepE/Etk N-terminal domain-containing protein [Belliella sp. DSM 107340]|uniref:Wzz/FepE/Etk N-terminal domain-containing protein n=1 Tax=Belliella calami TaxID=2923436 RepID=A0ABS9UNZ0_9BACT|nr:Wzz/FepE/Etk N-terminal domain-containing protein [Belliella calami]MCH7398351.1 Wzz/FepE/Etk N-terminal domain-containing protein [Belliella calami]